MIKRIILTLSLLFLVTLLLVVGLLWFYRFELGGQVLVPAVEKKLSQLSGLKIKINSVHPTLRGIKVDNIAVYDEEKKIALLNDIFMSDFWLESSEDWGLKLVGSELILTDHPLDINDLEIFIDSKGSEEKTNLKFQFRQPDIKASVEIVSDAVMVKSLEYADLKYENEAGDVYLSSSGGKYSGSYDLVKKKLLLKGNVRPGEVFLGQTYVKFPKKDALVQLECEPQDLNCKKIQIEIPEFIKTSGQWSWGSAIEFDGEIESTALEVIQANVTSPLLEYLPENANGALYWKGKVISDSPELRLQGQLEGSSNSLNFSNSEIKEIKFQLPLDLHCGATEKASGQKKKKGFIKFLSLSGDLFSAAKMNLPIEGSYNALSITSPFKFMFFNNPVNAKNLKLNKVCSAFELQAELFENQLSIESDSAQFSFKFPPFQISVLNNSLKFDSKFIAEAFEGDFEFSDFAIENVFSPYRLYTFSFDFKKVNLKKLSDWLGFGLVTGKARGKVKNLELVSTIPSAFQAEFSTEKGGSISFEAVNSISEISQGGSLAGMQKGLYSLFDTFNYSKFAFRSSLANDVFELRGLASDDSDRVIVKGSWIPPRIDVLTHSHKIAFKEMMERISRVKESKAKTDD